MYPLYVIYALVKHNEPDRAIDVLLHEVDRNFREGRFDWVDKIIEEIDIKRLDTNLIVGVLCATLPAKSKLTKRENFVKLATEYLTQLCPDRVEKLMIGLK